MPSSILMLPFLLVAVFASLAEPPHSGPPVFEGEGARVRSWVAGCGTGEDLWKWRDSSTIKCDPDGGPLTGTSGSFEWPVDLRSADFDTLVVEGVALGDLRWVLSWSSPEEPFVAERSSSSELSSDAGCLFDLDGIELWPGAVGRLRLDWTGTPSSTSRIVEVHATRRSPGRGE